MLSNKELLEMWGESSAMNPLVLSKEDDHRLQMILESRKAKSPVVYDRDKLLAGGVFSHADKKTYTTKREWDDHLKAHGCVEVGNDYNHMLKGRTEVAGNFECRKELTEAYRHVTGKL